MYVPSPLVARSGDLAGFRGKGSLLSLLDIMHVSTKHEKLAAPEWGQLSSRGGRRERAGHQGTLQPPAEAMRCGELWQVEQAQETENLGAAASSDTGEWLEVQPEI